MNDILIIWEIINDCDTKIYQIKADYAKYCKIHNYYSGNSSCTEEIERLISEIKVLCTRETLKFDADDENSQPFDIEGKFSVIVTGEL